MCRIMYNLRNYVMPLPAAWVMSKFTELVTRPSVVGSEEASVNPPPVGEGSAVK